jgi:hypothetical protein
MGRVLQSSLSQHFGLLIYINEPGCGARQTQPQACGRARADYVLLASVAGDDQKASPTQGGDIAFRSGVLQVCAWS